MTIADLVALEVFVRAEISTIKGAASFATPCPGHTGLAAETEAGSNVQGREGHESAHKGGLGRIGEIRCCGSEHGA